MRPIRKLTIALAGLSAMFAIVAASASAVPVYQYSGTHFGSVGTGPGQFKEIGGSTTDSAGNFWIVDNGGNRVEKFNSKGEYLMQISTSTGYGSDVAVSPEGNIWVTCAQCESVTEYSSTGTYIRKFGELGSGPGQFWYRQEIAISPTTGNIWVVDSANFRVQEFNSVGTFIKAFGSFGSEYKHFEYISGIAPNSFGGIAVLDQFGSGEHSRIVYISSAGEWGGEFTPGLGVTETDALASTGATGNQVKLWIADKTCLCIKVMSSTSVIAQFGSIEPSEGELIGPEAPVFDSSGNPWVVEPAKTMVQKFVPRAPLATTEAATEVGYFGATLNGKVNPEGSSASFQFEYGTTISYGKKTPSTVAGEGSVNTPVKQAVSGLGSNTTYHYRVVVTTAAGTAYGSDQTFKTTATPSMSKALEALGMINKFDGTTASLADFNSNWAMMPWSTTKGTDYSGGWGDGGPEYPNTGGAYYTPSISGTSSGTAAVVTMAHGTGAKGRYLSLWLDQANITGKKYGYELRITQGVNTLDVDDITLSKWSAGTQTMLASVSEVLISPGTSFALVDQGSTVSGWFKTGSEYTSLLSATDSSFAAGQSGFESNGHEIKTRLTEFKVGAL